MANVVYLVHHVHSTIGGDGRMHLEGVAHGDSALALLLGSLPSPTHGSTYRVVRYEVDGLGVGRSGVVHAEIGEDSGHEGAAHG